MMSGDAFNERGGQAAERRSDEEGSDPRLDSVSRVWRAAIGGLSRLFCLNKMEVMRSLK